MSYDVRIRAFLEEPENGSLKYPNTRDDYIGLMKLVADDSPDDFGEETLRPERQRLQDSGSRRQNTTTLFSWGLSQKISRTPDRYWRDNVDGFVDCVRGKCVRGKYMN